MMNSMIYFLILGIPECFGVISLGHILVGVSPSWHKSLRLAILFTLVLYAVRFSKVFSGVHTLLGLTCLFLYLWKRMDRDVIQSFVGASVSLFILFCLELFFQWIWVLVFRLNVETLNDQMWMLVGFPQVIAINLVFIAAQKRFKKNHQALIDAHGCNKDEEGNWCGK